MVTSFLLEPGYAPSKAEEATPEMIQEIAKTISIDRLREKCSEYGLTKIECSQGCTLDTFLDIYKSLPTKDLTCRFTPEGILQTSSSGTGHRGETEIIRRAFGILVLDECYKRGLAVSFIIA